MTLALMLTASVLQPVVGHYTDSRPTPHALSSGWRSRSPDCSCWRRHTPTGCSCSQRDCVGLGSSVFHPESSRIARMASGGRHGLAQSLFQVGGNLGSSIGPLVAAFVVAPFGQASLAWCSLLAVAGMVVVSRVGRWYRERQAHPSFAAAHRVHTHRATALSRARVGWSLAVLAALIFSKYFYLASLTSYYTFYLITKFHVSVRVAQLHLFVFLASVAAGTLLGGPIGDRIGRKHVIWGSILGVLPFTLALPLREPLLDNRADHRDRPDARVRILGDCGLRPGTRAGTGRTHLGRVLRVRVRNGGLGAAALGELADAIGIEAVYRICAFLPAIGLLTAFLPDVDSPAARTARQIARRSAH